MPQDEESEARRPKLAKAARLKIFYEELSEARPATSMDDAIELLTVTLLSVEDRFSGIERGTGTGDDGRMYPAKADNRRSVPGRSDVVRFRSKAHNTYISSEGAILIVDLSGDAAFFKPGSNGKVIEL